MRHQGVRDQRSLAAGELTVHHHRRQLDRRRGWVWSFYEWNRSERHTLRLSNGSQYQFRPHNHGECDHGRRAADLPRLRRVHVSERAEYHHPQPDLALRTGWRGLLRNVLPQLERQRAQILEPNDANEPGRRRDNRFALGRSVL